MRRAPGREIRGREQHPERRHGAATPRHATRRAPRRERDDAHAVAQLSRCPTSIPRRSDSPAASSSTAAARRRPAQRQGPSRGHDAENRHLAVEEDDVDRKAHEPRVHRRRRLAGGSPPPAARSRRPSSPRMRVERTRLPKGTAHKRRRYSTSTRSLRAESVRDTGTAPFLLRGCRPPTRIVCDRGIGSRIASAVPRIGETTSGSLKRGMLNLAAMLDQPASRSNLGVSATPKNGGFGRGTHDRSSIGFDPPFRFAARPDGGRARDSERR